MVKRINQLLIAGIASSLTLGTAAAALAAYIPPTDQVPPQTIGGTAGRRGDCKGLTPLAPINYLGQTSSSRPTFSWVVADTDPLPLEFVLYEYNANTARLNRQQKVLLKSTPGVMSFTIPQEWAELSPDRIYAWQVVALCDSKNSSGSSYRSPSQNPWLRNPVKFVEISEQLKTKLNASSLIDKINLYSEAGLWYDALDLALQNQGNPAVKQVKLDLLSKLAKVEKLREPQGLLPEERFSNALERIVVSERDNNSK